MVTLIQHTTYLDLAELHSYMDYDGESDDDSSIFSKVKLLPQKCKNFLLPERQKKSVDAGK